MNTMELSFQNQERLKKLSEAWDSEQISADISFKVSDLHLMLKNFLPLQDLIRSFASVSVKEPYGNYVESIEQEIKDLRQKLEEKNTEIDTLRTANKDLIKEKQNLLKREETLDKNLLEIKLSLTNQLHRKQEEINIAICEKIKLEKEIHNIKNENNNLKSEIKKIEKELTLYREKIEKANPSVIFLRQNEDLAAKFELNDLPQNNTEALIRTVAVFSQKNSITDLWDVIKERCENEKRCATKDESALLTSAIDWLNFYWPKTPFKKTIAHPNSAFDFNLQTKSKNTPTGDYISEMCLFGISDNNGMLLRKPLVMTE